MPWDGGTDYIPGTKAFADLFNDRFAEIAAYTNDIPVDDLEDGVNGALSLTGDEFALRLGIARLDANVSLGVSAADLSGCSITASSAGQFLVLGIFDFLIEAGPNALSETLATGTCVAGGTTQVSAAFASARTDAGGEGGGRVRATVSQFWVPTVSTGQAIKLQAKRTDTLPFGGSGGVVTSFQFHTSLAALRLS